jgi:hypothetical protein
LHGTFTNDQMGDQLFVFNDRTMRLLAAQAGLVVRKVILRERKRNVILRYSRRRDLWLQTLAHGILTSFCRVTTLKWTPGLTYVLQKS